MATNRPPACAPAQPQQLQRPSVAVAIFLVDHHIPWGYWACLLIPTNHFPSTFCHFYRPYLVQSVELGYIVSAACQLELQDLVH